MNRKERDWLFSKIGSLREISHGINKTIEYDDLWLSDTMVLSLNNFIKEINEKIGVK